MKDVRVIAAQGATLRGPCKVKLTKPQHEARQHILGDKYPRGGVFDLDGGQALNFKLGEKLKIELAGAERLNRAIFEWDEPEPEAAEPPKKTDDTAGKSDTPPGGSGDGSLSGGSGDDTSVSVATGSGQDTVSGSSA